MQNVDLSIKGVRPFYWGGQVTGQKTILKKLIDTFGFTEDDFDITYKTVLAPLLDKDGNQVYENNKLVQEVVIATDSKKNPIIDQVSFKKSVTKEDGTEGLSEGLKKFL
jgi:hypothetical protein